MTEIINELYYMLEDRAGQGMIKNEEVKRLEDERCALWDEVIHRLGEGGEEIREVIRSLDLELEDIHDKALFREAVRLGAELVRPEAGVAG